MRRRGGGRTCQVKTHQSHGLKAIIQTKRLFVSVASRSGSERALLRAAESRRSPGFASGNGTTPPNEIAVGSGRLSPMIPSRGFSPVTISVSSLTISATVMVVTAALSNMDAGKTAAVRKSAPRPMRKGLSNSCRDGDEEGWNPSAGQLP
jgi:hypothetical protein